jgi:uncharacterized protein YjeT (DUF2065 family)
MFVRVPKPYRLSLRSVLMGCFVLLGLCPALHAQAWKDAPAYSKELSHDVLRRSAFFMPLFGATYQEKFEVLLQTLPANTLRGVVIYNHGCGGQ